MENMKLGKYSVCSLVWHRREEQITGNIASQIFKKTLKTLKGRSKELPDVFEIVLRPIRWVAGCEQPSPPLPPPRVGGVLSKSSAAAAALALHQDFFAPSKPYFLFLCKSYF